MKEITIYGIGGSTWKLKVGEILTENLLGQLKDPEGVISFTIDDGRLYVPVRQIQCVFVE